MAITTPVQRIRLRRAIETAVRESAIRQHWNSGERRAHSRSARIHVDEYLDAVTRASGLAFYERLFAMWHVFHMPLFCLLIVTGIVHVVAVHLY